MLTKGRTRLGRVWMFLVVLAGCPSPTPVGPAPDFAISVLPEIISRTGAGTVGFRLTVEPLNGLTSEDVSVSLSGVPDGVPVDPGKDNVRVFISRGLQDFVLDIPASLASASYPIVVEATDGVRTHSVTVTLELLAATITTEETSTMLFLESRTPTESVRLGVRKDWGGAIVEVSWNGTNYVNSDDPGRQIQTSLWDGNDSYASQWGYNPVESGDHDFHGSPLLASKRMADGLYTKTQPLQWAPETFGGGQGSPVAGDAYIEKWISFVAGYSKAIQVHYKITHFGTDTHAVAPQELPVMYVNPLVGTFVSYSGNAPWTHDSLSTLDMPPVCCPAAVHTPELWGAYVDPSNSGIALFTPGQYPDGKGFNAGSTLNFTPTCPYSWDPGSVLEFDIFILVGKVADSRETIYALHEAGTAPSALPPIGYMDSPQDGATLTGTVSIQGWTWALSGLAEIDVLVDAADVGMAVTGIPRDVTPDYPGAPLNLGFEYQLDTRQFSNGSHRILVKATDLQGHRSTFRTAVVSFAN